MKTLTPEEYQAAIEDCSGTVPAEKFPILASLIVMGLFITAITFYMHVKNVPKKREKEYF